MPPLQPVHRGLTSQKLKFTAFALEAANSLSTTYFFYYIYFFTRSNFQFTAIQNLWLAAVLGFIYGIGSFFGGRSAHTLGYYSAVRIGIVTMLVTFLTCAFVSATWWAVVGLAMIGSVGMGFTWPGIEALVSEGETPARLPALVGLYNFVWSITGAISFFSGGAIMEKFGGRSIFFLPSALLLLELFLINYLEKVVDRQPAVMTEITPPLLHAEPEGCHATVPPKKFLNMAWLANPMAYLALNTVIATVPNLAARMNFSRATAGFICSIWLFSRSVTFVALRLWPGWHYRFSYLASAYLTLIISFAAILLAPNPWILAFAQIFFGMALGLIYYSSLFYSMDIGENKGEGGGIHEAAIGFGQGSGPSIAALALGFFPSIPGSGTCAVSIILALGFTGICWIRFAASGANRTLT
ncbi:MAG TPA: MFS transporter [Verrucomicrobiae bacterium]|jgi:MFS family permease